MWRSPRPKYAEPPNAAVKGGIGDRQNTPSSMTHPPKSPALTTIPPTSHTAVPTLHQTTNSPNARVRGSRGAAPPGRGRAVAIWRRPCRGNAGAMSSCRDDERRLERTPQQRQGQTGKSWGMGVVGGPGGRSPPGGEVPPPKGGGTSPDRRNCDQPPCTKIGIAFLLKNFLLSKVYHAKKPSDCT